VQRIAAVEAGGLQAIADMVMERYFHAAFRAANPELVAEARRNLLRTQAGGYVAACHAVAAVDWLDRLPQVACPTLVIAGKLDVGAPVAFSEAIAQRITGSKLVVFDDASHLSVAEQPARFTRAVREFLAALSAA